MEIYRSEYRIGKSEDDKEIRILDEADVQSQFQVIRSGEVIFPVIDELLVGKKWMIQSEPLSKEQLYSRLMKMIVLQEVPNRVPYYGSAFIEIGVYDGDPQEAANIANTIAIQYRKKRIIDNELTFTRLLTELKGEVEKQRKKVEDAKAEVLRFWRKNQTDVKAGEPYLDRPIGDVYAQEKEARARVAELAAGLDQIAKMTPDEMTENSVPLLNLVSVMDAKILPEYQNVKAQEATLTNAGVGEDDPRLKDLRAREEAYRERLKIRIETLRKNLTARLQIARQDLNVRERDIKAIEEQSLNPNSNDSEFLNARKKYFEEKKKLDDAETRYATQRMETAIRFQPVKIWEKAEPADVSSRPNVPMILLFASGVGLLFAIPGAVLLVVGLCMKDSPNGRRG